MGVKWFFKIGAPHQLSATVDTNTTRIPQLFILRTVRLHYFAYIYDEKIN